jgi:hypothetical protein
MIKKMMRTTVAAAGFAALLLSGACAHSNAADTSDKSVVEVRPENPAETGVAPGPALADSDGNVYSSSAAPGRGNAATVGTNTNVNNISTNRVEVTETTTLTTTPVEPVATIETTEPMTTTTTTETVAVPMTSSTQETTTTTPTRERLRKD